VSFWTFIDRAISVILLVMLALSLAIGATLLVRRSPDFLPCGAEESASADDSQDDASEGSEGASGEASDEEEGDASEVDEDDSPSEFPEVEFEEVPRTRVARHTGEPVVHDAV
jgi:hypothetical protein